MHPEFENNVHLTLFFYIMIVFINILALSMLAGCVALSASFVLNVCRALNEDRHC